MFSDFAMPLLIRICTRTFNYYAEKKDEFLFYMLYYFRRYVDVCYGNYQFYPRRIHQNVTSKMHVEDEYKSDIRLAKYCQIDIIYLQQ